MPRRLLHLDPATGASGDMLLAALLDLGRPELSADGLRAALASAGVPPHELEVRAVQRAGIAATQVTVVPREAEPHHRTLRDLLDLIGRAASLAPRVRETTERVLRRLAEVEGAIHGRPPEEVRFHEVGALDTLVDVLGAALGLAALGWPELSVGPLALGSGWLDCAHGRLPVPPPAVARLVAGWPIAASPAAGELLTPTGAALLTTLGRPAAALPPMRLLAVGSGAGSRELVAADDAPPAAAQGHGHAHEHAHAHARGVPNILRAFLGEPLPAAAASEAAPLAPELAALGEAGEPMVRLEATLDDLPATVLGALFERLAAAGAVEVAELPATLKKSRPGVLLVVLVPRARLGALAEAVFRETPTLGLRWWPVGRVTLAREWREVETPWGPVRVKLGRLGGPTGEVVTRMPEYEDCRKLAEQAGVPLKAVYEAAAAAAALRPAG